MHLRLSAELTYDFAAPAETLLLLEAARDDEQAVLSEHLQVTPPAALDRLDDPAGGERRVVVAASGRTRIRYAAEVEVARDPVRLPGLAQSPIRSLPVDALRYLRPSRYCPSDRFERFVASRFSGLTGGDRVQAILDWIAGNLRYESGVSDAATTALDTFTDRAGVCRDFAHLAIALCRASDIPARAVSAYAWRLEPADLHAVAEVFIGGAWRLVDPTGKAPVEGLVRVATGADAADIAFMSIFGEAELVSQAFAVERLDQAAPRAA
jgi:transglutaminase-like putative cysteine protease